MMPNIKNNIVKEELPYAGRIVDYIQDNDQLVLKVKLLNDPVNVYSRKWQLDYTPSSDFLKFCNHMGVNDEEPVDFEQFVHLPVVCTLYKDESAEMKISFLDYYWECYVDKEDYQEFFQLTDEQMEEYYYADVFELYGYSDEVNKEDYAMKFKKMNIEEGAMYGGVITSYAIDEDKRFFRVFVEAEDVKGVIFMKCIRYAEYTPSLLSDFCENMGIMDAKGNVDFNELIQMPVLISLTQGRDGNYYISDILPEGDEENGEE